MIYLTGLYLVRASVSQKGIMVLISNTKFLENLVCRERESAPRRYMKIKSVDYFFVWCICAVLASYIVSDHIDYDAIRAYLNPPKGSVEVFLEPLPEEPKTQATLSKREVYCLALNVYHEAKFEPFLGKVAVANVTYNRMLGGFGRDICKVVFARKQFSWTLRKDRLTEVPSGKRWKESKDAVHAFLGGYKIDELSDVKHYHADYIKKPYWANDMNQKVKIGKHIFYTVRRY